MRALRAFVVAVALLAAGVALVALCARTAGGPDAWKVALLAVASLPLVGFATRERR